MILTVYDVANNDSSITVGPFCVISLCKIVYIFTQTLFFVNPVLVCVTLLALTCYYLPKDLFT